MDGSPSAEPAKYEEQRSRDPYCGERWPWTKRRPGWSGGGKLGERREVGRDLLDGYGAERRRVRRELYRCARRDQQRERYQKFCRCGKPQPVTKAWRIPAQGGNCHADGGCKQR